MGVGWRVGGRVGARAEAQQAPVRCRAPTASSTTNNYYTQPHGALPIHPPTSPLPAQAHLSDARSHSKKSMSAFGSAACTSSRALQCSRSERDQLPLQSIGASAGAVGVVVWMEENNWGKGRPPLPPAAATTTSAVPPPCAALLSGRATNLRPLSTSWPRMCTWAFLAHSICARRWRKAGRGGWVGGSASWLHGWACGRRLDEGPGSGGEEGTGVACPRTFHPAVLPPALTQPPLACMQLHPCTLAASSPTPLVPPVTMMLVWARSSPADSG